MFKRQPKIEVVPESEYTDYSHRFQDESDNRSEYATKETYMIAALVPTSAILGFMAFDKPTPIIEQSTQMIPVSSTPIIEPTEIMTPISQLTQTPIAYSDANMIPVNAIGDASLDVLTTVLDPILQLMVTISFPIASIMVVGSMFFLLFGNEERAMSGVMKASLGFCLIQLSPMLLGILKTLGESVTPQ
ncbi:hypothetical protein [Psychrobacillus sp. BM2]|uniref:hypothetical protein n=1 Tax=Psychrobacillus sp. BM2 TaxID=3400421 RepID=UPI003B0201DC